MSPGQGARQNKVIYTVNLPTEFFTTSDPEVLSILQDRWGRERDPARQSHIREGHTQTVPAGGALDATMKIPLEPQI